jgi:hypothetical protein
MTALTPFWSIEHPCEESLLWVERQLSSAGMRLLRTFDLHDARLATSDCQCPHHGTGACDCQMVVALVYAQDHPPVTLVLHGNDGQSWISVIDGPGQHADPAIILAIKRALRAEAASDA